MRLQGTDTTVPWATGMSAKADWVDIDNPDWGPGEPSCWEQASAKGAARIIRGEGLWYVNGVIYVVSTSGGPAGQGQVFRSEEHTSELQSLMRISYAVFCLKK